MTARTELIARLRDSYVPGVNEDLRIAADMLEADGKLREAAQLALDAVEWAQSMIDTGGQSCQEAQLSDLSSTGACPAML